MLRSPPETRTRQIVSVPPVLDADVTIAVVPLGEKSDRSTFSTGFEKVTRQISEPAFVNWLSGVSRSIDTTVGGSRSASMLNGSDARLALEASSK